MAHLPSYVEFENREWGGDDVYGAESRTTDSLSRRRQPKVR